MRRAIQLARRGQGHVEPNPMVGCVIVKGHRVVGEGHHRRFGGPHAEVFALGQAGPQARGATAYVTLEPCNHFGKTPPCTDALLGAGIAAVIAALRDPNPRVAGKGLGILRRGGIVVTEGLLADEARELVAPYLKRFANGLPYVIAKWAQSIDGRLATAAGESKWISGEISRRRAHELRGRVDAVIVGSQTVLQDDPLLTCRDRPVRRLAERVVLDTRLRTPPRSRLVQTARQFPTRVFTAAAALDSARARALRAAGVLLQSVQLRGGHVSLRTVLRRLAAAGATNVLIEGGGQVLGAALDAHLVDECYVFVGPCLIGGGRAISVAGAGTARMNQLQPLQGLQIRRSGSDLLYHFKP